MASSSEPACSISSSTITSLTEAELVFLRNAITADATSLYRRSSYEYGKSLETRRNAFAELLDTNARFSYKEAVPMCQENGVLERALVAEHQKALASARRLLTAAQDDASFESGGRKLQQMIDAEKDLILVEAACKVDLVNLREALLKAAYSGMAS